MSRTYMRTRHAKFHQEGFVILPFIHFKLHARNFTPLFWNAWYAPTSLALLTSLPSDLLNTKLKQQALVCLFNMLSKNKFPVFHSKVGLYFAIRSQRKH